MRVFVEVGGGLVRVFSGKGREFYGVGWMILRPASMYYYLYDRMGDLRQRLRGFEWCFGG